MSLINFLDKFFYKNFSNNWDDNIFSKEIISHLKDTSLVLDLGAGAGIIESLNFKEKVKKGKIYGVDLDNRVLENQYIHKGFVSDINNLPFEDNYFDIIFCNNVFEHIEFPDKVLPEIFRVLKKEGYFLFKTPNKFHYMPLIASITPLWFHKTYNRVRGREMEDTFPTHYKLNSKKDIKKQLNKYGFKNTTIKLVEGRPEYLRLSAITYLFGILFERIVNKFKVLSCIRILIIGKTQK